MKNSRLGSRAGFTFIEVLVVAVILAIIFASLGMVLQSAGSLYGQGASSMALEQRGHRAMTRVVDALRAADGPSAALVPTAPFSVSLLDCQLNEGFGAGSTTWSTPRRVEFDAPTGTLTWFSEPGTANELATVWCRGITPMLEGEQFNGIDDNGNGLIDEAGFCVTREGNLLTFRLSVAGTSTAGAVIVDTWESRLLIRN